MSAFNHYNSKPVYLCMMTRKDVTKIGKIGGVRVKIKEPQSEYWRIAQHKKGMEMIRKFLETGEES